MEDATPDIRKLDMQCPNNTSFEFVYKIIDVVIKPLQKSFNIANRNREKQRITDLKKQKEKLQHSKNTKEERQKINSINEKLNSIFREQEKVSKISQLRNIIDNGENLNKNFYNLFRSELNRDKEIRIIKKDETNVITNSAEIDEFFKENYEKMLCKPANQISQDHKNINQFLKESCEELRDQIPNPMRNINIQITSSELRQAISRLKDSSSPGPDGIPSSLTKHLSKLIPNIFLTAVKNEISNEEDKPERSERLRARRIISIKKKNYQDRIGFASFCSLIPFTKSSPISSPPEQSATS